MKLTKIESYELFAKTIMNIEQTPEHIFYVGEYFGVYSVKISDGGKVYRFKDSNGFITERLVEDEE